MEQSIAPSLAAVSIIVLCYNDVYFSYYLINDFSMVNANEFRNAVLIATFAENTIKRFCMTKS